MSIFPQPIQDKSLVNWDIRGARAKFIEKEVKLYEREQKSPPIPQKHPEDYIVNTRHGTNPNVQRARQSNLEVNMPQGKSAFDLGGKKHYFVHQGEIKEKRSLENPYNLPQNYEYIQPYYPRSLNVQDIEGTNPGSLGNRVVKNKEQAQKLIQKEKSELQELKELQQNPYERYLDALDKFKQEMNVQGEYKDRHHYNVNPDNPYARVDHPRYLQDNYAKKEGSQSTNNLDRVVEKDHYNERNYQNIEEKKQENEDEGYKPRQFKEENKLQDRQIAAQQKEQSREQDQQDYQRYLEYLKEQEYEKIKREYEQEKEKKQGDYRVDQGYPQRENEYASNKNTKEISLLRGQQDRRDYEQNESQRDQQNVRQSQNRQPSPDTILKRQGVPSSYKSQPNLLKLNHQSEIINHALNNISPQITKQNLAPNLNIEGYINYGKGARLNPTSMSYVGTELGNKNITMTHSLLGNQIFVKERDQRQQSKDPLRYTQTQLNFQKFEKYPGEFVDILRAQGKAPTNENLFQLQYERAGAPKSTMDQIIKYPVNVYEKGQANLDHYKKENNHLPKYRELPSDYIQSTRNSAVYSQQQQTEEPRDQNSVKNYVPYGAPFSYNPNEYKKKQMVALNHSTQLEKIEQSIDNVDKKIDNIQSRSPDIQQPHIKKTLNPEHYSEILQQIRAEEEEKYRNKLEYQKYLESRPNQDHTAGLGYYEDKLKQMKADPKSVEYIQQYGARGLRNLSNVRIF